MTTLQAAESFAIVVELALIVLLLLAMRRKPAATTADPLPANIAPLMESVPPPPGAEVIRVKNGSWVRVGTPAYEQAVSSGLVEK